jgi:hypothetical protein
LWPAIAAGWKLSSYLTELELINTFKFSSICLLNKLLTAMNEKKKACDLCGLEVEVQGFKLRTKEGDKEFCCEGCRGIYEMLHEDMALSAQDTMDEGK